jgi:replicative DNA helicase
MDGKLPYNLTIERTILAEILLNKNTSNIIFYKVREDFFYVQSHKHIFKASKEIYDEKIEVNIDIVCDRLKLAGLLETLGGVKTLIDLINTIVITNNIETYIVLLIDKYLRRQVIDAANKIQILSYQSFDSIESLFDEAETILFRITQDKPTSNLLLTSEVLLETFADLEKRSLQSTYSGIKSGFFDLDMVTQGFQKSDLIIIAGRPSMGKTAFALNLARNVAELQDWPVAIFSLEMSRQQLIYRLLSTESQVVHSKLRTGNVNRDEWYAISKAINVLANLKIYLDDTPNLSLISIRTKVNTLNTKHGGIGMIVLDYLQLLSDPNTRDSRVQELSRLTRGLKILAKEFDTPILVLSQLSRSVESRVNKRPVLSDLRESGCVSGEMRLYLHDYNKYTTIETFLENKIKKSILVLKNLDYSCLYHLINIKRGFSTGIRLLYRVQLFNHHLLKLTIKHKVLTLRGWIPLENLCSKDLLSALDITNLSKFLYFSLFYNSLKKRLIPDLSFVIIKSIDVDGYNLSYDLWVPSHNNYFINNSCVHNSIEQDADLVLMLYRDSYYTENVNDDTTEVIVAKHRNGPVGSINLIFDPKTVTFNNLMF